MVETTHYYLEAPELRYTEFPEYVIEKGAIYRRIKTVENCPCCGQPVLVDALKYVRELTEEDIERHKAASERLRAMVREAFNK